MDKNDSLDEEFPQEPLYLEDIVAKMQNTLEEDGGWEEDFSPLFSPILLPDESGAVREYDLIGETEWNGREYALLAPVDGEGDIEVFSVAADCEETAYENDADLYERVSDEALTEEILTAYRDENLFTLLMNFFEEPVEMDGRRFDFLTYRKIDGLYYIFFRPCDKIPEEEKRIRIYQSDFLICSLALDYGIENASFAPVAGEEWKKVYRAFYEEFQNTFEFLP